jgi:hypothetical protein
MHAGSRMLLSSALRGVMRLREPDEMRVFFFKDEFAALGHLTIYIFLPEGV